MHKFNAISLKWIDIICSKWYIFQSIKCSSQSSNPRRNCEIRKLTSQVSSLAKLHIFISFSQSIKGMQSRRRENRPYRSDYRATGIGRNDYDLMRNSAAAESNGYTSRRNYAHPQPYGLESGRNYEYSRAHHNQQRYSHRYVGKINQPLLYLIISLHC